MSEHLRDRLREEMSGLQRPPVDTLVVGAVAKAARARRVRRTASGVGTAAVVGVTVLAVTMGSQLAPGAGSSTASVDAGSPARVSAAQHPAAAVPAQKRAELAAKAQASEAQASEAQASKAKAKAKAKANAKATATAKAKASARPASPATPATPATSSSGALVGKAGALGSHKDPAMLAWNDAREAAAKLDPPHWTALPAGVPATAGGELELFKTLTEQYGTLSNTAVTADDPLHVQAYLHRAGSTGMVRLTLSRDTAGYGSDCAPAPAAYKDVFQGLSVSCSHTGDGGYVVVLSNPGNCIQTSSVTVVHPDGSAVSLDLATCLQWDGTQNKVAPQILTPAEASAIGSDPRWDLSMQQSLVDAGAHDFLPLANFS
jgi:hypothetical protein